MRALKSLLARFGADERGAFLALFGLLAIALIATAGAVVDFTSVQQARTRAQVALDAAALALQPRIFDDDYTTEDIRAAAEALLIERLDDDRIDAEVESATTDPDEGTLELIARMRVPLNFVTLVGVPEMNVSLISEATRKHLNLEVVMVLDNSGSMRDWEYNWAMRMTRLREATTNAVEILFGGEEVSDNVFIGIVPFNHIVNVGSSNASAAWIDQGGLSSITNDNFDNDDNDTNAYTLSVNRHTLYNQLTNVDWDGCIEARPTPYDTNDTTPTTSNPDTLFTIQFAPDNPDSWGSSYNSYMSDTPAACMGSATCTWTQTRNRCQTWTNCHSSSVTTNTYAPPSPMPANMSSSQTCTCSSTGPWLSDTGTPNSSCVVGGGGTSPRNRTCTRVRTCAFAYTPTNLSNRELQERICKYTGAVTASFLPEKGPNYDCVDAPILPLTNVKQDVLDRIDEMEPEAGTNIAQGAIWGFHVLSPTEPFTQGLAYDAASNSKVMILMTDGDNNPGGWVSYSSNMNGLSYPSAYGYRWNGRLPGDNTLDLWYEMNDRTQTSCTNAKAAGITVYTIGLSSTNQTSITMLTNCASDPGKAYFPANSSDLNAVFEDIANQLADLRLAQ